jgi:hypothetical protein
MVDSKMADIDMQLKQGTLIEFLFAEGEKLTCIYECLLRVYGEDAVIVIILFDSG